MVFRMKFTFTESITAILFPERGSPPFIFTYPSSKNNDNVIAKVLDQFETNQYVIMNRSQECDAKAIGFFAKDAAMLFKLSLETSLWRQE
jgi:hypothetical protein